MRPFIPLFVVLLGIILCSGVPVVAQTEAVFNYYSECIEDVCDWVGQGESATWTDADGSWAAIRNSDNGVSLSFWEDPGSSSWYLDFVAADDVELSPGYYPNAERYPFQNPGHPGLDISGEGRGCNSLSGEFTVTDVRFDWFGDPVLFDAAFEQHCSSAIPALYGDISYQDGTLGPLTLTEGNILISYKDRIYEYSPAGAFVHEIPIMESTGTLPEATENPRDLVVGMDGQFHLFNGTFDPVLSTVDTGTGTWRHDTFSDWATLNNVTHGGIAAAGDYVFVTDGVTGGDGIIRFDTASGFSAQRFLDPIPSVFGFIDVTMGLDGRLYALHSDYSTVDLFLPESMVHIRRVSLAKDVRGVTANAAGKMFGASGDGNIYRFDASGNVEASIDPVDVGNLQDIDISRSGSIVVGTWYVHGFVLTDESLSSTSLIEISSAFDGNFVAFVQSPPEVVFDTNGFESGDTSFWSSATGLLAGFLDVNGDAAAAGSFGLEVMIGGTCGSPDDLVITSPAAISGVFEACNSITASGVDVVSPGATFQAGSSIVIGNDFSVESDAPFTAAIDSALVDGFAYVEDDSPSSETVYNARFDLRLDSLALGDSDQIDHFNGYSSNGESQFRVILKRNAALEENRLALAVRKDDGSFAETPSGEEILLPDGWNSLQITWRAGNGNGFLLVSINGSVFVGLADLDNDTKRIDFVRWGAIAGSVGSTTGSLELDNFTSWR